MSVAPEVIIPRYIRVPEPDVAIISDISDSVAPI